MNQTDGAERAKSARLAKIERVTADIGKTKAKIAEFQAKLRAQEQQKIALENEEIIALYRKEKLTEDDLIALVKSKRDSEPDENGGSPPVSGAERETRYADSATSRAEMPRKEDNDSEN